MIAEIDPFYLFRWVLATVCTVYVIVVTAQSLKRWLSYFGQSRETAVLGRYTLVLLIRIKLRRFIWPMGQIVMLLTVLLGMIYLHRWVEASL